MTLELQNIDTLELIAGTDAAGGLQLFHQGRALSEYGDQVLVRSSADSIAVIVTDDAGGTIGASHENDDGDLVRWSGSAGSVTHSFSEPTTDPLEITVQVGAAAEGTKAKKVRIEAKPGGALPDRDG